jgi:hypothetical protein
VVIVGNNPEAYRLPIFESQGEIWVLNGKGATLPRYDMVFQMHLPCDWGGGWSRRWLRDNTTVPVMMREAYPEVPMARAYPFEDVFGMLKNATHRGNPLRLFTSSVAWAIALAVLWDRKEISLYGLDLGEQEYVKQKEGFAFWTGFAAGRGIELEINCADIIFSQSLYGAQPLRE